MAEKAEKTERKMDAPAAEPAPPEAKPDPPRFVGGKPRELVVELDYPLEYGGRLYKSITVRRPTVAQVRDFVQALSDNQNSHARLPMFDAPFEVLDSLDPDDDDRLAEAMENFLPRRLRQAAEPIPQDGAATSPSPPPSSAGPEAS